MLFLIWLVLSLVALFLILLFPALWEFNYYRKYSGWRTVTCPEDQQSATVHLDGRHAVATGMHGLPKLRLSDCTRWPERSECRRGCLVQAVRTEADMPDQAKTGRKAIYHLPVLVAAFAAWCLGAFWHAQYLFRPHWTDALGLTHAEVKHIVWWLAPHVLTAGICLLFAYGVAWLLAVCHRCGVLAGILMAVLLCGALVTANWYGFAGLPHDLLVLEAGYIVLATLVVGAVVGGLNSRLVLPSP